MKVYLHFEEMGWPTHTVSSEVDARSTCFEDLIDVFVASYNAVYTRHHVAGCNLKLFNVEGKQIALLRSLVSSIVGDKDDIVVKLKNSDAITVLSYIVPGEEIHGMCPEKRREHTSPEMKAERAELKRRKSSELIGFKRDIEIHIRDKAYRIARNFCEQCLKTFPEESYVFYGAIARIKLANRDYDAAIKYALLAVKATSKTTADPSVFNFTLAEALFHSPGRCDEADEVLEKMLLKKFSDFLPKKFTLDVRTLRAECLFNLNQHEAAANLVNGHMHWDGAVEHLPTLIAYTRFAMTYKKVEEAVRALLKAIVIDQKNESCRRMLAEILSTDAGYAELTKQVPLTPASAAAYAFLATAVKDCSGMIPCIRLLVDALSLRPESASFALNLVHALEITGELKEAYNVIKTFCITNPSLKIGDLGFTGSQLLVALNGVFPTEDYQFQGKLAYIPGTDIALDSRISRISSNSTDANGFNTPRVKSYDFTQFKGVDNGAVSVGKMKEYYSIDNLDFLALAFAAVKIAYIEGNFNVLPALHYLIDATRYNSSETLHTTSIRNEHAYYQCIIQVLAEREMTVSTDRVSPVPSAAVPIPPDTLIEKLNKIETLSINDTIALPPANEKSKSRRLSETQSGTQCGTQSGTESGSGSEGETGGTVTPVSGSQFEKCWSVKLSVDGRIIAQAAERPIYMCGDSHCLSPAWSVLYLDDTAQPTSPMEFERINDTNETNHKCTKNEKTHRNDKSDKNGRSVGSVGNGGSEESEKDEKELEGLRQKAGIPRLLVPKLVTGIKQWHLRPQGDFYPKASFQQSVSSIPREADVIFMVGEIDCREGLLVAVERDRYATLQEGIECTVNIFMAALVKVISAKRFQVFIHPVVPVLNETRAIVTEFNAIYRRKVENLKGAVWLDIYDDLLTADGKSLKPDYAMDGTHLNPSYVELLEKALQKHLTSSK